MTRFNNELKSYVEVDTVEQGFRGSKTFDILDGIYRMGDAIISGDEILLDQAREYVMTQDDAELGEAVMPNIISSVEVVYDSESKSLSQSGFDMSVMLDNGLVAASAFKEDKMFEYKRRYAEHQNYFKKLLPNIERILNGQAQFLEVSPAPSPDAVDLDSANSLGYDVEEGIGVVRLYRASKKNEGGIEILQIKLPTDYPSCEKLLIDQGLAKTNEFDQNREMDGSLVLSKGGFIKRDVEVYDLVRDYLINDNSESRIYKELRDEMHHYQEMLKPRREKYMRKLNTYQENMISNIIDRYFEGSTEIFPGTSVSKLLSEDLKERLRKDLTLEKVRIWREFVSEINSDAEIVVEMEKDGISGLVQIDKEGKLRICGQEVDASLEDMLNAGAKLTKITSIITSDESGELAFSCPTCGGINQRSPLFPGALISRCMFCGSTAVGCDEGEENPLCIKIEDDMYEKLIA